jgi:hypothetical protein
MIELFHFFFKFYSECRMRIELNFLRIKSSIRESRIELSDMSRNKTYPLDSSERSKLNRTYTVHFGMLKISEKSFASN